MLRDMVKRGLLFPTSITSDGAPGLVKAIEDVFFQSLRIRCWVHRMKNFREKVSAESWPEVKGDLSAIRETRDYQTELRMAQEFIVKYQDCFSSLVACFQDDLEALLHHLKIPFPHRKFTGKLA